jgi:hypothetical protein
VLLLLITAEMGALVATKLPGILPSSAIVIDLLDTGKRTDDEFSCCASLPHGPDVVDIAIIELASVLPDRADWI